MANPGANHFDGQPCFAIYLLDNTRHRHGRHGQRSACADTCLKCSRSAKRRGAVAPAEEPWKPFLLAPPRPASSPTLPNPSPSHDPALRATARTLPHGPHGRSSQHCPTCCACHLPAFGLGLSAAFFFQRIQRILLALAQAPCTHTRVPEFACAEVISPGRIY
ncbi:hypothetical protein EJ04DRAFT_597153 [Polyplosphaeria fusca]|uniref:Uncharacterized protein n=1 Tax=Polyplosphaeria fusca TaxID=682080 RepID=A0A9P4R3T8_9PLEO|nr:hypothetical protein EJ04DRAFT_597153 [Polyplosphaeria fusca]